MDFSKVKLLIILVFLMLNGFLAYQWWTLQSVVSVYSEPVSDQLANVQSELAHHLVRVSIPVATSQPAPMALLRVTYDHTPLTAVAASILSLKPKQVVPFLQGKNRVVTPYCVIQQTGTGQFQVRYIPQSPVGRVAIDPNHVVESTRQWLLKHGYNASTYQFAWQTRTGKESRIITYVEQYNAMPVFTAMLRVEIVRGMLVNYSQTSVNVLDTRGLHPVINAVGALLSLAQFLDKADISADNTIIDMRLGYQGVITDTADYYLTPVWRVTTTRGVIYINALTGEVGVGSR